MAVDVEIAVEAPDELSARVISDLVFEDLHVLGDFARVLSIAPLGDPLVLAPGAAPDSHLMLQEGGSRA